MRDCSELSSGFCVYVAAAAATAAAVFSAAHFLLAFVVDGGRCRSSNIDDDEPVKLFFSMIE